ncbi:HlyD family efflux transporter periplasmic adaptor subunit [Selenomonas sp. TAMA-11512]|uniref:HlyD family efflux transporter periplasmic adaptor subunit n=1 Tax=Selenomonas sp. TAMA-11512 TaxID=3095337 RepID=UPI003085A4E4|nr:HlyD family efflux transporter periplasmic adaptor subunit [Selenomonas sp. TAMA-11512]
MKKKIFVLLVILVGFAAGYIYWQNSCKEPETLTLHGNVDLREVTIAFRESDRIKEILVEEGDRVKADDVLARLENRELMINLAKARAQVSNDENTLLRLQNGTREEEKAQARAKVEQARAAAMDADMTYRRNLAVYQSTEGVSRQTVDRAKATRDARYAELHETEAALEQAENGPRVEDIRAAEAKLAYAKGEAERLEYLLGEYELRAPSDGVIRSRLLEVGAMAGPGAPVFKLSLDDKKWVRAYVQEKDFSKIYEGKAVMIYVDSLDEPVRGQIGYISNTAEFTPKNIETEELRTALVYEIRIFVNDAENVLRMGMPVTVKVK